MGRCVCIKNGSKKILGIIVVCVVLIVFAPSIFYTIYRAVYPVAAITDVNVGYTEFSDYGLYTAYFRLRDTSNCYAASDGKVNIKITQNNVNLYDNTFTVCENQFGKGPTLGGGSFSFYRWIFPSSDVPVQGMPSLTPHLYSDNPKNVTATITFTTPQGRTLTGTDDVWEFP